MNSYTHMLVLLVILGTLIMAKTAVRFAKRADVFRRIAVEYRWNHLRMQGKKPVRDEIEEEILLKAEAMERGEQ